MDKVLHVLGAAFLGATLSPARQVGLCVGYSVLFAWEVWQGSMATGVVEGADVLAGAIGLTGSWILFLRGPHPWPRPRLVARSDPSPWDPWEPRSVVPGPSAPHDLLSAKSPAALDRAA
jgi:hypothetical protein